MTAEGTDLSTDVLSIDGDQRSPERLSAASILERAVQSTKVPREPILIPENEGEKNFRASRRLINTTHLYALPSAAYISAPVVPSQFDISGYATG